MNLKNLNIGTQLKLSIAAMLLLVILLGLVSFWQTSQIHNQIEIMYNHPLKVRLAIGELRSDLLSIQLEMNDVFQSTDEKVIVLKLNQIEMLKTNAFEQIEVFYRQFLGPPSNIDSLKQAFVKWNFIREESIRLFRAGKTMEAVNRNLDSGIEQSQAKVVFGCLQKIDDFATKKGDDLYANSRIISYSLNKQLIFWIAAILLLSLIINYILSYNILKPIRELTNTIKQFHNGDLNTRSAYTSKNEFGLLSNSFNNLIESIQLSLDIKEKFSNLAALMLSEYDTKKFFRATLEALATHTGSQMAAIYLLNDDKTSFRHFESIGVDDNARQSFAANSLEGEFGFALSSRKVQHLQNIPKDTRFVFHTVSGKFIPHEIITIPILADNEVVAIISLATISNYSKQSIQLIDNILVTLCARIEGILAYHRIIEFSAQLETQNHELEAQKTELAAQSYELMEQNTELEMQKKQLDEGSRLKTNFLSNMSHELRTPLNSVIALSGVLNRRLLNQIPEEEYSYIEVIERNGKLLLSLINDILDISRIEAGYEEIELTNFDANSMISDILSMINLQSEQKNIELIHIASDTELLITSDKSKCSHIIQNLVGNAVKFTEKGKVEVVAKLINDHVVITVIDTGIGIAEKHLSKIFDEFHQVDGSTSRKFSGTGLGLAIAMKYANLLGGTITVKSSHGFGSEFSLILPLCYDVENRIFETEVETDFNNAIKQNLYKPVSGSFFKTILLVEDSEPAIIQIKDFFEESGYQVMVAHNGNEALTFIDQTIPDAMIIDLMMPGIDGFELLKTLREAEQTAHIPVLILTAKHITKEELRFLKRNNIHQLIQKGDVNCKELLNTVASMVFSESSQVLKPTQKLQQIEGKPVVIVVEDNPDNMLTVKALLSDNYIVIESNDGKEGVDMARKHKPNLILMDIALPEMDGIEAFKTIRQDPHLQHIPIIALTASAMTTDRETILAHGFDAYIAKPIDDTKFFKIIHETLYGK